MCALLGAALPATAAECVARSGERTAALVELYSARRCAGCDEAERRLARLAAAAPQALVPLVSYVARADYVAPRDTSTAQRVAARERRLLLRQRMALVYTPHLRVQGSELPAWDSRAFDAALERVRAQPARARLRLELLAAGPEGLTVRVEAEALEGAQRRDIAAYVAAVDLLKDALPRILEWHGPITPGEDGRVLAQRRVRPVPGARPGRSGVAAFVQSRRTEEVLQAVLLGACSP
ncbi:MAG TPA: DUF1223 domain-containing protein [Burkholderiales bacterium]